MIAGQWLCFSKEIVASGFDYFVRGAGCGVFALLLAEHFFAILRKLSISEPRLVWLVSQTDPSSLFMRVSAKLVWCIPLSVLSLGSLYFVADGYLDATSVAILIPSLVLIALILGAAYKKQLFLWQVRNLPDSSVGERAHDIVRSRSDVFLQFSAQLTVYLLSPLLAYSLLIVCSHYFSWESLVRYANSQSLNHSFDLYRGIAIVEGCNICISALAAGAIIYLIDVIMYQWVLRVSLWRVAFSAGPIFNALLVCWSLFYILPTIRLVLFSPDLVGGLHWAIARDVFRVCIALSTFLSSFTGLAVAFAKNSKADSETQDAGA